MERDDCTPSGLIQLGSVSGDTQGDGAPYRERVGLDFAPGLSEE